MIKSIKVGDDHDQKHKKWQLPWFRTQKGRGGAYKEKTMNMIKSTKVGDNHNQEHKKKQWGWSRTQGGGWTQEKKWLWSIAKA